MTFITAYRIEHKSPLTGEVFATSGFTGDGSFKDLNTAIARAKAISKYRPVAAVFTQTAWIFGGKPHWLKDQRDKLQTGIKGLEGLINSMPSNHL